MRSNEWPLIGFTLAAQGAVGIVLILASTYPWLADQVGEGRAENLAVVTLIVALALLGLSAGAASLHLGNLRNVYLVLANWRSSWLSREVVMVGVFAAAVVVYATMYLTGVGRGATRGVFGVVASVVGLTLVATIAKLYMLRTVPVWNRSATPLTFFATTLVFGLVGIALAIAVLDGDRTEGIQQMLGVLTLVVLAAQLAIFEGHRRRLHAEGGAGGASGRLLSGDLAGYATARLGIAVTAVLILAPTVFGWFPRLAGLIAAALLVVASETLGRYLFYGSYARSGL